MSKRLQVIIPDEEAGRLQELARSKGLTVSELVRQSLRGAGGDRAKIDRSSKLAAVRAAGRHSFPTGEIDQLLSEIERGYKFE